MLIVSSNCPKLVTPWQSYFHGYGEFLLMSLVTLLKFHCSALNAKHLVWRFSSCFWLNRIFRSHWIFHPHFQWHRKWTAFDWQRVINCWLETQFNSTKNYLSSDFIIKKNSFYLFFSNLYTYLPFPLMSRAFVREKRRPQIPHLIMHRWLNVFWHFAASNFFVNIEIST